MAELDTDRRLLIVKIVYYGPALSGKTTNLVQLHELMDPGACGEFMKLETRGDRTLFFDLLPVMITGSNGFRTKIKLFTVPGQVAHDATRKAVLSRADGVVFVADSQVCQSISNFESFSNLEAHAARVGLDFEKLPLVVQFNKRDLSDIIAEADVLDRWRRTGLPVLFASAIHARGVMETFGAVLERTYQHLDHTLSLGERFGVSEARFLKVARSRDAA